MTAELKPALPGMTVVPRWSIHRPKLPGKYEIKCAETDHKPEPVVVRYNNAGDLLVTDQNLGELPIRSYHDGLTTLRWRLVEEQPTLELWRVFCGIVSGKPYLAYDLGEGFISLKNGYRNRTPRDARDESYHDTRQQAVARLLADAQREVNEAEAELKRAKARLKRATSKFANECAAL